MTRLIVAEIKCTCGKQINVRLREKKPGDQQEKLCWKCNSRITLKGTKGFVNNKPAQWTDVISEETIKDSD